MTLEKQIQQILLYSNSSASKSSSIFSFQTLANSSCIYAIVGEFLVDLKKFRGGDNQITKIAELKRIEQKSKTIEKFVQEFRRATRESSYEEKPLVECFKREINRVIRKKLQRQKDLLGVQSNSIKEQ